MSLCKDQMPNKMLHTGFTYVECGHHKYTYRPTVQEKSVYKLQQELNSPHRCACIALEAIIYCPCAHLGYAANLQLHISPVFRKAAVLLHCIRVDFVHGVHHHCFVCCMYTWQCIHMTCIVDVCIAVTMSSTMFMYVLQSLAWLLSLLSFWQYAYGHGSCAGGGSWATMLKALGSFASSNNAEGSYV